MGDASRQLSDARHLLGLDQLELELASFGEVHIDHLDRRLLADLDECGSHVHGKRLSVGASEVEVLPLAGAGLDGFAE